MTKSDSLDNITLDSDDIRTIERFENNYYNRKNNILQNGGSNKLEKNIKRLYNCYVLSQNQNGGDNNNELSSQVKKRLDKKIGELIAHNYDLEGGETIVTVAITSAIIEAINYEVKKYITSHIISQIPNENTTKRNVEHLLAGMDIKAIVLQKISENTKNSLSSLCDGVVNGATCILNFNSKINNLKQIQMEFKPTQTIPQLPAKR